ncbi:MAG: hypothetical protein PHO17_04975 [Proteiniphilum sp.]|nr:hypothetical protein [Proteiniphilum sp.]
MKKLIINFLIFHTVVMAVTGVGIWLLLETFFPTLLVKGYYIIPLFFYLLGILFITQFRHSAITHPTKMVNLYMLLKVIKVFVSFITILIYWFIHQAGIRSFAIVFIIFYLIDLVWETYIYLRMEKYIRNKSEHNKTPKEQIEL